MTKRMMTRIVAKLLAGPALTLIGVTLVPESSVSATTFTCPDIGKCKGDDTCPGDNTSETSQCKHTCFQGQEESGAISCKPDA